MSKFSQFMKSNKAEKKNEMYAVTKSLCDEKGIPLEWEFRHITSKENEILREKCTLEVPVTGKPNVFRSKFRSGEYVKKMIAGSDECGTAGLLWCKDAGRSAVGDGGRSGRVQ